MFSIQRLVREPALIVGVITATVGLAVAFGVHVTDAQLGAIVVFLGAVMALVRFLTTPSSEVLTQVKPSGLVVAGPAAAAPTGTPLTVLSQPADASGALAPFVEPVQVKGPPLS